MPAQKDVDAINRFHESNSAHRSRALSSVQEFLASKGGDVDMEDLSKGALPASGFPLLIFGGAFVKDMLDALDFTIVGTIVVFFVTIVFSIILALWCLGKVSGGFWKKAMIGWVLKRAGIFLMLEFMPFLQIVPATMIFVLMVYYRETKIGKIMNEGLEQLHRAGIKP